MTSEQTQEFDDALVAVLEAVWGEGSVHSALPIVAHAASAETALTTTTLPPSPRLNCMTHPTHRLNHVTATASDWGLSQPKEHGEDARKRTLAAVATDLNGRLKECCKSADSPSGAALEMRRHLALFARYGLPNPKATQLVRDLTMKAFTSHKR